MSAYRKASIRELTQAAYRLDGHFTQGVLQRDSEGKWMVGTQTLDQWLRQFEGQDITLIGFSMESDSPLEKITCRTCGREYVGYECPYCREVRLRLRGR